MRACAPPVLRGLPRIYEELALNGKMLLGARRGAISSEAALRRAQVGARLLRGILCGYGSAGRREDQTAYF